MRVQSLIARQKKTFHLKRCVQRKYKKKLEYFVNGTNKESVKVVLVEKERDQ